MSGFARLLVSRETEQEAIENIKDTIREYLTAIADHSA